MREWFKQNNPSAYQSITARMLEAVRHNYWKPSEDVVESLATEYEKSVAENGASCCHHTCGNPSLNDFVSGMVSVPGYSKQIEAATKTKTKTKTMKTTEETQSNGGSHKSHSTGNASLVSTTISSSNQTSQDSNRGYGTDISEPSPESKKSADPDYVEGYEMQNESEQKPGNSGVSFSGSDIFGILFVVVAVGGIYLGFHKKKL